MPWREQTRLTASILAMETGWPPPELLVTVSIASGMLGAPSETIRDSSAAASMLPLKSRRACVSAASGMGRSTARAPVNSMLARVVSKWVLEGTTWPGRHMTVNKDTLGGAALVGGDHVAETGQVVCHALEAEEAFAAGVGFVAAHHGGPLFGGHGAGAGIGEQV